MEKILCLLLSAVFAFSLLVGCSSEKPLDTSDLGTLEGVGTDIDTDAVTTTVTDAGNDQTPPPEAELIKLASNVSFTYSNGAWRYSQEKLIAANAAVGDSFAVTDIFVPPNTAFEFEAKMTITSGTAGGIAFGIKSIESPSSCWYCVNVDKTQKNARLFSVGQGTVGTNSSVRASLTSAQLSSKSYLLNVKVTETGRITYTLDGKEVGSYQEQVGVYGFIALNTYKSDATFENIRYKVGEYVPGSDSIFTSVNGTWGYSAGALTSNNSKLGDSFSMSSINVPSNTEFTVEADVTFLGGSNTGGIVFGVSNPHSPSSGWYCVNFARDTRVARLFSSGKGSVGTNMAQTSVTMSGLDFDDTYRMYLNVSRDGMITYKINGETVRTYEQKGFAGGYIGFNSFKSNVKFSNIQITVGGEQISLTKTRLVIGDKTYYLDPSRSYQYLETDVGAESGKILTDDSARYKIRCNGETGADGVFTIEYGRNHVYIDVVDEYGRCFTSLVEIWREIPEELIYEDTYRPSYHFTPPSNFMNDPNGLWYDASKGLYHMYYQYNPYGMKIGNQVWGHAVSEDLLNWTDAGIAINRDSDDCIFSGSCVVDRDNTSGLFDDTTPPDRRVVAIYTTTAPFKQEIAYSTDGGYTFVKYKGNPVIASSSYYSTFRDPKVQWLEEYDLWLMIIAGGPGEIYTSPDLIHWTSHGLIRDINGKNIESECPMLLALPLDGNKNNVKYVYVGSGKFYVVGDLVYQNGKMSFIAEQGRVDGLFLSNVHYATQDFYNDVYGRTLLVSWMKDSSSAFLVEDKYWHGIQSLPYVTSLVSENGKMQLRFSMIEELRELSGEQLIKVENKTVGTADGAITADSEVSFVRLKAKLDSSERITLKLRDSGARYVSLVCSYQSSGALSLILDASLSSDAVKRSKISTTVQTDADGYFTLDILLDNSVIDVFTNDGKVLSDYFFASEDGEGISLTVNGQVYVAEYSVVDLG